MENITKYMKGFIVGDAMGVPYEFYTREQMTKNPCVGMTEYLTHNQPKGTWSDDTSMTLATMDGINKKDINFEKIMDNFLSWVKYGKYTTNGKLFDIGGTCNRAINRYRMGEDISTCGCKEIFDNGNGSLMRIAPVTFFLRKNYGNDFFNESRAYGYIEGVSELTHGHPISIISCGFYVSTMNEILNNPNGNKIDIVQKACNAIFKAKKFGIYDEIEMFDTLKNIEEFKNIPFENVKSSGYVIDTLFSAIWLFLNKDNTYDAIITAINLGNDTDTVSAIAGSMAGIIYGIDSIPKNWIDTLLKRDYLIELTKKFEEKVNE